MNVIQLIGRSGTVYSFTIANLAAPWNSVPGIYAFVSQATLLSPLLVHYIGECQSFATRMPPNHERWDEARRDHYATMILAMVTSGGDAVRKQIERDLIEHYNPPMNTHHRTYGLGILAAAGNPLRSIR
jgi:hypothetical protein